jgi:gliding motility-associated-like protein
MDIADGLILDETNASDLTAGEYRIHVRQDQNGCNLVSISDTFLISEPEEFLDFDITVVENSLTNLPTGSISLIVFPSGSDPYETRLEMNTSFFPGQDIVRDWVVISNDPGSGNYSYTHQDIYSGIYDVYVRDQIGCEITRRVTVGYDSTLFIPNIFTPNGDNHNDYFEISNLPASGSGTTLVITNRWGKVIFESNDYHEDNLWNGGDYPDGTYFYRLSIPNQGNYSGWIEIWRGR